MKTRAVWLAAMWLLPMPLAAQTPAVITMDQEPHHHLALHNDYVKVFKVEVSPGDSIVLHRHDQDTVAIAIGEQLVTVGIPGKPDVHQKNVDAQVRLQRGGYVHSTHVDGDTPYHTIAVELLHPQTGFQNVCAEILPGQPLNCPAPPVKTSPTYTRQPLLESDQTQVWLVRVPPHESKKMAESLPYPVDSRLIVALNAASISSSSAKEPEKALQPGDFMWFDGGERHERGYQNRSDKEARFLEFIFPRVP